jgi:hypothetical protein
LLKTAHFQQGSSNNLARKQQGTGLFQQAASKEAAREQQAGYWGPEFLSFRNTSFIFVYFPLFSYPCQEINYNAP